MCLVACQVYDEVLVKNEGCLADVGLQTTITGKKGESYSKASITDLRHVHGKVEEKW